MENKWATIKWETTQKIDYVDIGDLKQFLMEDSTPRKQKSTGFFPFSGKKLHRMSNIKITDLICDVTQKISFIW